MPELLSRGDPGRSMPDRERVGSEPPVPATGSSRSATSPVLRQEAEQTASLTLGTVDEAIDRLVAQACRRALAPQPSGDLLGRPADREPFDHGIRQSGDAHQLGQPLAALPCSVVRHLRVVAAQIGPLVVHEPVARQLAVDRRAMPTEPRGDLVHRHAALPDPIDRSTLVVVQLDVAPTGRRSVSGCGTQGRALDSHGTTPYASRRSHLAVALGLERTIDAFLSRRSRSGRAASWPRTMHRSSEPVFSRYSRGASVRRA